MDLEEIVHKIVSDIKATHNAILYIS